MVNSAKRNITSINTYKVDEGFFVKEENFQEIEEKTGISFSLNVRTKINDALKLYLLLKQMEENGENASHIVETLEKHLSELEVFLSFFDKANKVGSIENKARSQILRFAEQKMPGLNVARQTSAPLKQYRDLLIRLLGNLSNVKGIDGRSRNVAFNTLLRELTLVHQIILRENGRTRFNKLNFVLALFHFLPTPHRPQKGPDYASKEALKTSLKRASEKIRGHK